MRETPTSLNINDFRQRYLRSFGFLVDPKTEKKTLIQISDVGSERVLFNTLNGSGFFAYVNMGAVFEFLPITRGWFATEVGPVLLQRIPARQFNRGITRANTSAYSVTSLNDWTPWDLTLKLMHDVFVEPKPNKINAECFLLNQFFLVNYGKVYFYQQEVGEFKEGTIILNDTLVLQEVLDAVARGSFKISVKVVE